MQYNFLDHKKASQRATAGEQAINNLANDSLAAPYKPSGRSLTLSRYQTERKAALEQLNLAWARMYIVGATTNEIALIAMHQMRYECDDIDQHLRVASREWLQSQGHARLYELPWQM